MMYKGFKEVYVKIISKSNVVWSLISLIINALISYFLVSYITNNVGAEAYGLIGLSSTFISYIDIVGVAFNSFACRFIAGEYHQNKIDKANKYYSTVIIANALFAILIVIGLGLFTYNAENIINIGTELVAEFKILFILITVQYVISLFRNILDIATFIANRIDIQEKARISSLLVQMIVLLVLFSIGETTIVYVGIAYVISNIFNLSIQYYNKYKLASNLHFKKENFSLLYLGDIVSQGIWNSINNMGNILNTGLDLLVTNLMLSGSEMGMVAIVKQISTLCYKFVMAASNARRPIILKMYVNNDTEGLIKNIKTSMKLTGSIVLVFFSIFYGCGVDLYNIWVPNLDKEQMYLLTLIALLYVLIIGIVNPLYYIYTLTKKMIVPCVITIIMGISNVLIMYYFLRYKGAGVEIVLLSTLVVNIIHIIDAPIYSSICLKIKWYTFYPVMIKYAVIASLLAIILFPIHKISINFNIVVMLLLKIIVSFIISILMIFKTWMNKEEMINSL